MQFNLYRAFIHHIDHPGISFSLVAFHQHFLGSYIVAVNAIPTFSSSSIQAILSNLCAASSPDSTVAIVLAPECKSDVHTSSGSPLHLRPHDLQHICALCSVP
jgi:hypothetical protein